MLRPIRIAILLTILVIVAGSQWLKENRLGRWDKSLWMTIYPILAEPDKDLQNFADGLQVRSFRDIGLFLRQQAAHYGRGSQEPLVIQVARPLDHLPPSLPVENSGFSVALWSLKMRWWVWMNGRQDGLAPADVQMFVVYQKKPSDGQLERSVGMRKGSYGVVNAVAGRQMAAHNRIVITHELLHILGATDKYELYTGQPIAPDGLANPKQSPLYPQTRAEIMAGRIAVSTNRRRNPASLKACAVGNKTAREIGWLTD